MTAVEGATWLDTDRHRPADCPFDSHEFRRTMGLFATGVTVVTALADWPHGMTANAFTSVSKEPPLVLVCVDREAVMHGRILAAGAFAISVLSAAQEHLARYFADRLRPEGLAQFAPVEWSPGPQTGAPLLTGAVAWLECDLREVHVAGDHSIFVGSVLDLTRTTERSALLFFGGRFCEVSRD